MIHQRQRCWRYKTDERHAIAGHNGNSSVYPDPIAAVSSITVTGSQSTDRPVMSPSGCRCCGALSPTEGSGTEHLREGALHPSEESQSFTLGHPIAVQMFRVPDSSFLPTASSSQPPASIFLPPASSHLFRTDLLSKLYHSLGFMLACSR